MERSLVGNTNQVNKDFISSFIQMGSNLKQKNALAQQTSYYVIFQLRNAFGVHTTVTFRPQAAK